MPPFEVKHIKELGLITRMMRAKCMRGVRLMIAGDKHRCNLALRGSKTARSVAIYGPI